MKKSINLLFWGYLLVLVRIEFGIDLLPVPLGYFIIATGCLQLSRQYPIAQKARNFATAMIFISFPTIFLDVYQQSHLLWQSYALLLMIFQLIVVYFILRLLEEVLYDYGTPILKQRLKFFTTVYIVGHLLYLTAVTFTPNFAFSGWLLFISSFMFIIFILDIIFLIVLRAVRKHVL